MNPNDIATAKSSVIKLIITFVVLLIFTGVLIYIVLQIDDTSAMFHISPQSVPTTINGITAVTSITIGFSVAFIGIIVRELLIDKKTNK